ncbi:hypothetical protein CKAH01_12897 [Colletotrichum kahawae]|uniref:Uncharacterized protein n=1 Tax=Colletotrichum kahawae TaxID=34407 RepID=A0AAD9YSZ7_COLKA|nr:hypothetical protein CKAH01_12897 [Colletotrichum kahawae]
MDKFLAKAGYRIVDRAADSGRGSFQESTKVNKWSPKTAGVSRRAGDAAWRGVLLVRSSVHTGNMTNMSLNHALPSGAPVRGAIDADDAVMSSQSRREARDAVVKLLSPPPKPLTAYPLLREARSFAR